MASFTGEFECKLDAKGRLVLPSKMKALLPESLGQEMMLRKGLEPCLELIPMLEVRKDHSKLASLDDTDDEVRAFKRSFFRRESPVELDATGRFVIPKNMLRHAQLGKDATVIGIGTKIEIWNPDLHEEFSAKEEATYKSLNKKFLGKSG
ncbi:MULTISPECIES: division/cell wall cluster transcriptional repressor MraZ [Cyclobacterium]|uniref:Transcriptional regulator MraZ n=1 Tax=Cyclobacterium plantarum TaxID=2716263 RepID=A0ABX0H828_9BACT|nr:MULTISPECIES: division/cell wall cluster transcriptional repressor MraZ [Cyclobacterium]MBD3626956.1 division/cell wall cluster transcriptional repressor MraZ [Cyclobacterium sp.]NHE58034.1 division/cell wall cluster transcriptional repressor MraZ [Cyclobacterium plantarum]